MHQIGAMMARLRRELEVDEVRTTFLEEEGRLCIRFTVWRLGGETYYAQEELDRGNLREGFIIDRAIGRLRNHMIANGEKFKHG